MKTQCSQEKIYIFLKKVLSSFPTSTIHEEDEGGDAFTGCHLRNRPQKQYEMECQTLISLFMSRVSVFAWTHNGLS